MRAFTHITVLSLLVAGLTLSATAADDLKVVLLDSKDGHALRGKLVCMLIPVGDPRGGVVDRSHVCRRTDSGGAAAFDLPEVELEKVDIALASDGLLPCFAARTIKLAEALKTGTVAPNTCGDAETGTTEPGELVLFAHQTSLWEAMKSVHNEF